MIEQEHAAGEGEEIGTDLLDRALAADLANIAKKAADGHLLTNREREMLQAERERRRMGEKPDSSFVLEEGGAPNPLERMTQAQLATAWGYSVRAIKGWIADGKDRKDPVPLTRPAEMPGWFERIHAPRKCPDKLFQAAQRLLQGNEAAAEAAKAAVPPPVAAVRVEIPEEAKGLLAMLDRLRTAEAALHGKYMAAIDANNETRAQFLLTEWSRMSEKLRQAEKAAPAALEAAGIYVRKDEIQRELEPLHAAIIKSFRQRLRKARVKLQRAASADEWNQLVDVEVDEVAGMLAATEFVEPLELEAA